MGTITNIDSGQEAEQPKTDDGKMSFNELPSYSTL